MSWVQYFIIERIALEMVLVMATLRRRFGLGTKLIIVLLTAVVIPTIVVAAILIRSRQATVRSESFVIAHGSAESVADRVRDFLTGSQAVLMGVTLYEGFPNLNNMAKKQTIEELFTRFDYFDSIFIWDANGKQTAYTKIRVPAGVPSKKDLTDAYLETKAKGRYVSDVYFLGDGNAVILLAVPITRPNNIQEGVIGGLVNLRVLNSIVSGVGIGKTGLAYIVDSEARIVAYPRDQKNIIGTSLKSYGFFKEAISGRPDLSFSREDVYQDPTGSQVVGTYRYMPELRWSVIVQQPVSVAFGPDYRRIGSALLLTLLFASLFMVVGYFLVRIITMPLEFLTHGAEILGSGNLQYRIELHTGDEMERLADTLNKMAENLHSSRSIIEEEHRKTVSAAKESRTLYRISQALVSTLDLHERLHVVAESIASVCHTNKVIIWLIESNRLIPYAFHGLSKEETEIFSSWDLPVIESTRLTQQAFKERRAIIVNDVKKDGRVPTDVFMKLEMRSLLALPFVFENRAIGLAITYEKGHVRRFSEYQMKLVKAVAAQAAVAIEHSKAYERERRIAETLQRSFLPDIPKAIGDFEFADKYAPAWSEAEIGGDLYDVIELSPSRLALVIADVSGKGLSAAVHTVLIKYVLRAYAIRISDPKEVIRELNNAVYRFIGGQAFVTLFFGILDVDEHTLTYVNAGHELPLVYSDDRQICDELMTTGTALGIIENSEYSSKLIKFAPGDLLILYTDGATEARHGKEFLGINGLKSLFCRLPSLGVEQIVTEISQGIQDFSEGELRDDVALLVVKYGRGETDVNPGVTNTDA